MLLASTGKCVLLCLVDYIVQSRLCDIVQDNSLHQLVQHGTRGSNILDLVFTNDLTIVGNTDVVDGLDGSDHNAVQFGAKLCIPRTKQPKRYVYKFKNAKFNDFRSHLASIPWECTQLDGDIEENWQKRKDIQCSSRSVHPQSTMEVFQIQKLAD